MWIKSSIACLEKVDAVQQPYWFQGHLQGNLCADHDDRTLNISSIKYHFFSIKMRV